MAQPEPTRATPIPQGPLGLGLLGLLPFVGAALALYSSNEGVAAFAFSSFVIYAAVILSFLGGVRWGLEIARAPQAPSSLRLIFSVLPSLGGWGLALWSLSQPERHGAAAAFAGLFAAQYAWDRASGPEGLAPAWYPLLRQILTGGVMLACVMLMAADYLRLI